MARDGDGNETTVTNGYTVTEPPHPPPPPPPAGLAFQGFLGPIHNGSCSRRRRNPDRLLARRHPGLDVLADSSPTSVQTDCANPARDWRRSVLQRRGLTFNSWTGHYVFIWLTRKAWAGTCRTLSSARATAASSV